MTKCPACGTNFFFKKIYNCTCQLEEECPCFDTGSKLKGSLIREAIEVARFYANKNVYNHVGETEEDFKLMNDRGDKARQFLAKVGK
jgi:hypothetical protein